jgi:hypothetical protein
MVQILNRDLGPIRAYYEALPDAREPEFPAFIEMVRRYSAPSERITVVAPGERWSDQTYAYYRASWFLPDRRVFPAMDRDDQLLIHYLAEADVIAAWKTSLVAPDHSVVAVFDHGRIYRRRR